MAETFDFKEGIYFIKPVSSEVLAEATKVYAKSFNKALVEGAILKKSLEDYMRRQGLWDDAKQEEYLSLIKKSADIEYKIKSGKITKASEVVNKAIELKRLRVEMSELMSDRNSLDGLTAEGQAESARFNYLVSACAYDYKTQKPVYSSVDEYIEKSATELANVLAGKFAAYMYGLEENFENSLLENKVLKKLNRIDSKGNLVDKQGRRVDFEGNLLDDNGARVDSKGQRIDINNNPVIDDSVLDSLEFEDDTPV